MRIPRIKFSIPKNNSLYSMRQSFNCFCSRAENIISRQQNITGLLPDSMRKNKDTGLTTAGLIELILKNL